MADKNLSLFDDSENLEWFKDEWQDMLEYKQDDLSPELSIVVHFKDDKDRNEFAKLVDQKITYLTKSIWYPKAEIGVVVNKRYVDESKEDIKYENYPEPDEIPEDMIDDSEFDNILPPDETIN